MGAFLLSCMLGFTYVRARAREDVERPPVP